VVLGVAAALLTAIAIVVAVLCAVMLTLIGDNALRVPFVYFAMIAGVYLIPPFGGFVIGAPIWAWMMLAARANSRTAAQVGALTGISAFLIFDALYFRSFDIAGLFCVAYGLAGALSWWIGWRVMRPPKSDENAWET
jgi:hypothetical protein